MSSGDGHLTQIRVHMDIGHPLIGDPLTWMQQTKLKATLKKVDFEDDVQEKVISFNHQALHAAAISLFIRAQRRRCPLNAIFLKTMRPF